MPGHIYSRKHSRVNVAHLRKSASLMRIRAVFETSGRHGQHHQSSRYEAARGVYGQRVGEDKGYVAILVTQHTLFPAIGSVGVTDSDLTKHGWRRNGDGGRQRHRLASNRPRARPEDLVNISGGRSKSLIQLFRLFGGETRCG